MIDFPQGLVILLTSTDGAVYVESDEYLWVMAS